MLLGIGDEDCGMRKHYDICTHFDLRSFLLKRFTRSHLNKSEKNMLFNEQYYLARFGGAAKSAIRSLQHL
jgi:hypothetical protein